MGRDAPVGLAWGFWSWVAGVTVGVAGFAPWLVVVLTFALAVTWLLPVAQRASGFGAALALGFGGLWGMQAAEAPPAWSQPQTVEANLVVEQGGGGVVIGLAEIDGAPWKVRLTHAPADWGIGTRARALLRLFPPHSSRNFGISSFEDYLTREGIGATGYVKSVLAVRPSDGFRGGLQRWIWDQHPSHPAILTALGLGERGGLDRTERQLWQQSGVAHLLAISGLHVGLVIGGVFWLVRRGVPRLAPWWCQRHRIEAWAAGVGLLAGVAFGALAGWSVPTLRAVVMAAFLMAGWLFERRHLPGLALAWAAASLALANPGDLLGPGFWLSFTAVGVLLALLTPMAAMIHPLPRWFRPVAAMLLATGVAGLATAPWGLWFFGQIPTLSLLANAAAIPLTTLVLVPGVLAVALLWGVGLECIASAILAGLDHSIGFLEEGLAWGMAWFPPWHPTTPEVLGASLLGALGVAAALALRRGWWRVTGVGVALAALAMAWLSLPPQPVSQPLLVALDVGQAQSVLLRDGAGHAVLVDAGGNGSPRFDPGADAIAPALRALGVTSLDALVLSHRQRDHAGGAAGVLGAMPVGALMVPPEPSAPPSRFWCEVEKTAARLGVPLRERHRGDVFVVGKSRFEVLWPPLGRRLRGNGNSLVLAMEGEIGRWILPGDLERPEEGRIDWSRAEGLLMPHHGSRTSSSGLLVDTAMPRVVLVSAGYLNRYGFPAPEVVARYRANGAEIWNTAEAGAIAVGRSGVSTARGRGCPLLSLPGLGVLPSPRCETFP